MKFLTYIKDLDFRYVVLRLLLRLSRLLLHGLAENKYRKINIHPKKLMTR